MADSKYILIAHGEGGDHGLVVVCDTEAELIEATRYEMYHEGKCDADEFAAVVATLKDDGIMTFEGDAPIEWRRATFVPFADFIASQR